MQRDYAERVYAGVLGKIIGVYLGRPFEGWPYSMIQERLGDVEYYVHDKLNVPLVVTDDDISGTFTFLRALEDHGSGADLSSREVGESWLNYLIKERTILWWGGLGNSTEHTAYLRLASGIEAPASGSMELNGKVVSEQIGSQIFIDGWAMVCPGDPDQAAKFAEAAARVSHDGEAVYGAQVIAAMEAMAFLESDIDKLVDKALAYIPTDSVIATMIEDIRGWHAREKDWRATREMLAASYGYDKYGGNCHMVPNHGLIIHSLLHGEGDFSDTLKIVNTCGWDTDCNSGNVGCLMGIRGGLEAIDAGLDRGFDWRGPVSDRLYIPTADGGRAISDCAGEAVRIVNMGRALVGESPIAPKDGAQFHFHFPGSVQGFQVTEGEVRLTNCSLQPGARALRIDFSGETRVGSPVFTPSKAVAKYFEGRAYSLMASPRVFPGQTLEAVVAAVGEGIEASVYVSYYGEDDEPASVDGDAVAVRAEKNTRLTMEIPALPGPIFEVGVKLAGHSGTLYLDSMRWSGAPEVIFERPPHRGTMWRRAWVNGVDAMTKGTESFRLIQNRGSGLIMQGTREWRDYSVSADVTPHLSARSGIAARVQGLTRYYGWLLKAGNRLQLTRMLHEETVLVDLPFEWKLGETHQLTLELNGSRLIGKVNGAVLADCQDLELEAGAVGLVIEEGRVGVNRVRVSGLSASIGGQASSVE